MITGTCSSCGETFVRESHEKWKKLCLACWKERQPSASQKDEHTRVVAQLAERVNALIAVCNSKSLDPEDQALACDLLDWLYRVRRRIGDGG